MSLFKHLFRAQWDALHSQGSELETVNAKIRELETCLVVAKDARCIWAERAKKAEDRVNKLEAERRTPAIAPNPFRLNPVDGTMGYLLILAQYSGELDEWVLEDDGAHQGWRTASMIGVG